MPAELVVGGGVLGFWSALDEVYPKTRQQRCWIHKAVNVLNYLLKRVQPKAKKALQEIWMAEYHVSDQKAFDNLVRSCRAKYPKAVGSLEKDWEALL